MRLRIQLTGSVRQKGKRPRGEVRSTGRMPACKGRFRLTDELDDSGFGPRACHSERTEECPAKKVMLPPSSACQAAASAGIDLNFIPVAPIDSSSMKHPAHLFRLHPAPAQRDGEIVHVATGMDARRHPVFHAPTLPTPRQLHGELPFSVNFPIKRWGKP